MQEFSWESASISHAFRFNLYYKTVTAGSGNYCNAEKVFSPSEQKIHVQMMLWSLLVRSKLTEQQLL